MKVTMVMRDWLSHVVLWRDFSVANALFILGIGRCREWSFRMGFGRLFGGAGGGGAGNMHLNHRRFNIAGYREL